MTQRRGTVPEGEGLRRAVRWLAGRRPVTAAMVEEASRRFDLSPLEEEFLLREMRGGRRREDGPGRP